MTASTKPFSSFHQRRGEPEDVPQVGATDREIVHRSIIGHCDAALDSACTQHSARAIAIASAAESTFWRVLATSRAGFGSGEPNTGLRAAVYGTGFEVRILSGAVVAVAIRHDFACEPSVVRRCPRVRTSPAGRDT